MSKKIKIRLCSCGNPLEKAKRICNQCKKKRIIDKKRKSLERKVKSNFETAKKRWDLRKDFIMHTFRSLMTYENLESELHQISSMLRNFARELPETRIPYIHEKYSQWSKDLLTPDHLNSMIQIIKSIIENWDRLNLDNPDNMFNFLIKYNIIVEKIPKKINRDPKYTSIQGGKGLDLNDVWKIHGTFLDEMGNPMNRKKFDDILKDRLIGELNKNKN